MWEMLIDSYPSCCVANLGIVVVLAVLLVVINIYDSRGK